MTNVARDADWIAIKGEYLAGVKSVRELGRLYGVSEGAIRKRAKTDPLGGWGERGGATAKAEIVKAHFGQSTQKKEQRVKPKAGSIQKTQATPNGTHPPDRVLNAVPYTDADVYPAQVIAENATQYATPHKERRTPRSLARATVEEAAAQDIEDMESALSNARRALELVSDSLDFLEQLTEPVLAIKSIETMLRTNQLAIDQIRRIRSLDASAQKMDEMEAFKKLAEKGWIPEELLIAVHREYVRVKPTIKATFRSHFQLEQEETSEQCG